MFLQTSEAALVGVDFEASASPSPTNWNEINGATTVSDLIDEDGSVTAIDITVTGSGAVLPLNVGATPSTIPSHPNSISNAENVIWSMFDNNSITISLSDLQANALYKIWVLGLRSSSVLDQTVTIDGIGSESFNQSAPANDLNVNELVGDSANTLDSYARTVTSSATGSITITIQGSATAPASVAAVAIELNTFASIPTLSGWGMIILSLLIGVISVVYIRKQQSVRI